jgi:hypothetical protein
MIRSSAKTVKTATAALAVAMAGAAVPAAFTPAEAKPIIVKGPHFHPHIGRFVVGGLALAGAYEASTSCYWLKVRALGTDSAYWWDRYHACIGD